MESLLAHYQLTADVCSKQISDVHLEKISRSHCKDWRRLPPHLEIETIVASDIDRYQVGEDEKRREFFFCWKQRKGYGATYLYLIRGLLKIGSRQDAESVCKLLQPSMSGGLLYGQADRSDDYPDFTLQNVLAELADVTNWRDLGLQLGLSPAKLDAIGTESDPKVKMITAWMDQNPGATGASWKKLMRALASPAVCENRVAKGIAEKRGSSFDKESALKYQSLGGSSASATIDFTEASVRNAIVNVKDTLKLGELLKIPPGMLHDIHGHPPEVRKLMLVAAWFKVDPNCNWKKLEKAIQNIEEAEWKSKNQIQSKRTVPSHPPKLQEIKDYMKSLANTDLIQVGVALGLNYTRLKDIRENLLDEMLTKWLRGDDEVHETSGDPTWESLVRALEKAGYNGVAMKIRKDH